MRKKILKRIALVALSFLLHSSLYAQATTGDANVGVIAKDVKVGNWVLGSDSWPGTGGFTFRGNNDVIFGVNGDGASKASFQIDGAFIQAEPYKTNIYAGPSLFNNNVNFPGGIWNSAGNVGIGTGAPNCKLHVYVREPLGHVAGNYKRLTRTESNGDANAIFINDYMYRETNGEDWSSTSYLRGISVDVSFLEPNTLRSWVKQNPYTEKVEFGSSGKTFMSVGKNVGIGTINPQTKLHVSGDATINGSIVTKEIHFYSDGGWGSDNSDPYTLRKVHDANNVSHLDLNLNDDADESFRIYGNSCNGYGCGTYSGNLYHSFDASGNVYHAGNVGIGVVSPQHKLDVKGTICANEVLVKSVDWADFVFDKNYKLRDLKEVDQYIQENGHLPEIPSAAEVKEKGVNLVEVQAKLLQKVEELTLYTIQLKKEIEQLKATKK